MNAPSEPQAPTPRDRARQVLAGGALLLAVLFALFNLDGVKINWVFGTFRTPLIVAIVVVFALGLGAGLLIARRRD
jgi:uncharacterized integral membrane protein